MAKMNEEAERMNEANEFFTALMNACKRVQIEQKADELTSSVKNKPLQSSILDFGRSGLALVPSTIKRNFVWIHFCSSLPLLPSSSSLPLLSLSLYSLSLALSFSLLRSHLFSARSQGGDQRHKMQSRRKHVRNRK
jgi:hypothetical protein